MILKLLLVLFEMYLVFVIYRIYKQIKIYKKDFKKYGYGFVRHNYGRNFIKNKIIQISISIILLTAMAIFSLKTACI